MIRVGLLSDTHGLLRPEALSFLQGSSVIVHGGDVGGPDILAELRKVAPVIAVRGNNDIGSWVEQCPPSQQLTIAGQTLYVIHDRADLDVDPVASRIQAVVSGHSHRASIERAAGVLYVNPGSAGPRRFRLPVTVAELILDGGAMHARIVELAVPATRPRRPDTVQ